MSTLHDLVHHGIKNPHSWPVIADAFEEHGDPDTAEIFRSKRTAKDPSYTPETEDDYEVIDHSETRNPFDRRITYSVVRRGDNEPLSTHHSAQDAHATIQDMVADKLSSLDDYVNHVRQHGREIAPKIHLVDDGKHVHLHDFRHLDSGEGYDPESVEPVATFVKGVRTKLSRYPEFLAKLKKLDGEQQKRFFARLEELEKEKYGERLGTKNPVMLYHGSPHDLHELKVTEGQRANTALFGFNYPVQNQGVFLSDSPAVARYFGQNRADTPSDAQVYKVYANLDKILDLTGRPGIWRKLDDPKYVAKIKAKGYHGAKFHEDAHVRKATDPKAHSYIIFNPEKHTVVHRAENRNIKTPEDVEAHQDRFLPFAREDKTNRAHITGLTPGGNCEHCGKKDVALIHIRGEDSGKEVKLGSTCAGRLCTKNDGSKLHRAELIKHGHGMNLLHREGKVAPVYPVIRYDSDRLDLARHITDIAHSFNPDKSPTAYADALAEVGHPLALFVRRAKPGVPLIKTSAGHEWTSLPGQRGRKELHVPRVRALEAPDLGIHRVGFHYDPEAGSGHIVVTMKTTDPVSARETTWHAPATRQELRDLGLRNRRMKLARSQFQGFDKGTEALLPHVTDPVSRGIVADRLEELGDPLHHVFRSREASILDPEYRGGRLRTYIIRKSRSLDGLHIAMNAVKNPQHVLVRVRHGNRKNGTHRWTTGTVTPEQAKDIVAYHYTGRGKTPKDVVDNYPLKLARPDVVADGISRQQGVRRKLAAKIALQAGLRLQALLDARTETQAGVLQTYGHENEPDAVDYAAAWYGLLSRSPRLTSFHVHEGGPDTYHTWKTSADPDTVLRTAKGLGLNAVVTSAGDVAILDRGNAADAPITTLKEATYATAPRRETGTAKPFGGRDDYRATIRGYEQSVFGNRPSPAPGAGTNPAAA